MHWIGFGMALVDYKMVGSASTDILILDSIAHDDIAEFRRDSRLSWLNSGLKRPDL